GLCRDQFGGEVVVETIGPEHDASKQHDPLHPRNRRAQTAGGAGAPVFAMVVSRAGTRPLLVVAIWPGFGERLASLLPCGSRTPSRRITRMQADVARRRRDALSLVSVRTRRLR